MFKECSCQHGGFVIAVQQVLESLKLIEYDQIGLKRGKAHGSQFASEPSDQVVAQLRILPGDSAVVAITGKAFAAFLQICIEFGIFTDCPPERLGKIRIQIFGGKVFGFGSPVFLTRCRLKNIKQADAQPSPSLTLRQGQVIQHPIKYGPFVSMPPSATGMVECGARGQADEVHLVLSQGPHLSRQVGQPRGD